MLRFIYLLLTTLTILSTVSGITIIEKSNDDDKIQPIGFETSHRRPNDTTFSTSHKIQNDRPIIKYDNIDVTTMTADDRKMRAIDELMQKKKFLSKTDKRPELNPQLSMLINEDIMKIIESKRISDIEEENYKTIPTTTTTSSTSIDDIYETTTTSSSSILTTQSSNIIKSTHLDDDLVIIDDDEAQQQNTGLVDKTINLDFAGSENNKKSRIQVKKGPNGEEYEYEYVYYYYDDDNYDDLPNNKSKTSSLSSKVIDDKKTKSMEITKEQRGKSRYTNIDRTVNNGGGGGGDNEIKQKQQQQQSTQKSGRFSIPVTEDVDEGRLPQITRFPPRNSKIEQQQLSTTEQNGATGSTINTNGKKKHHVKRPSLDLIDSETFNTDDKQIKSNRNLEKPNTTTLSTAAQQSSVVVAAAAAPSPTNNGESSKINDNTNENDIESTTPFMEKVAFDLYAILANENFNIDSSTDSSDLVITTTDDNATNDDLTTISNDDINTALPIDGTTISSAAAITTTTTTTTPAPTTTTTTTTTPAPTTTTVSLPGNRRGSTNIGRNRFRLHGNHPSTTTTIADSSSDDKPTTKPKSSSRFHRPSFGGRKQPRPAPVTTETQSSVKNNNNNDVKTETQKATTRGRNRNRFNLRGSTTTTEKNPNENAIDHDASTTARTLRVRPTLNLRGRSRPTLSTTTTISSSASGSIIDPSADSEENDNNNSGEKQNKLPTRPASRFNLNRPVGSNRLLPARNRINPLQQKTTTTVSPKQQSDGNSDTTQALEGDNTDGSSSSSSSSTTNGGTLNRLKQRPRLQIQKTEKTKPVAAAINRKVNPLLGRRKLQIGATSTEAPNDDESDDSDNKEPNNNSNLNESSATNNEKNDDENDSDNVTEHIIEVSSEQPRGLGLLGQRRRLPLRKPGTLF